MFNYGSNPTILLISQLASALLITAIVFWLGNPGAPIILLGCSVLILIYAFFLHRAQFAADYKYSTWQEGFKPYAHLAMTGLVLLLIYGGYAMTTDKFIGGRRRR
jgi:hypothetical protein